MDSKLLHNVLGSIFGDTSTPAQDVEKDLQFYVETDLDDEATHNLELVVIFRKHTNNWLSVYVSWHSKEGVPKEDMWKYQRVRPSFDSFTYSEAERTFNFGEFEEDVSPKLTIGLATKEEDVESPLSYDVVYHKAYKYEVTVWFAPKGWEDWNNTVDLYNSNTDTDENKDN